MAALAVHGKTAPPLPCQVALSLRNERGGLNRAVTARCCSKGMAVEEGFDRYRLWGHGVVLGLVGSSMCHRPAAQRGWPKAVIGRCSVTLSSPITGPIWTTLLEPSSPQLCAVSTRPSYRLLTLSHAGTSAKTQPTATCGTSGRPPWRPAMPSTCSMTLHGRSSPKRPSRAFTSVSK